MEWKSRVRSIVSGATIALVAIAEADAHPHVFADAQLEVALDSARQVVFLRHIWRFDDAFSSTVLLEFDGNLDLVLDDDELKRVASTIGSSIAEYNYFQLVTQDGKDISMIPPARLVANFYKDQLFLQFETQPKSPLTLSGTIAIGVYDPTYYTAIEYFNDDSIAVSALPQACARSVIRPDPDTIPLRQGTLADAFFNNPGGSFDLGKLFATRVELNCPG